jgi:hypothetical protein
MSLFTVHISIYKSNFFISVSNNYGKVLFLKSAGCFGFKNTSKKSPEALNTGLRAMFKYILILEKSYFFLKLEGGNEDSLDVIYKQFYNGFLTRGSNCHSGKKTK